jgi:uncharacterized repeat protein (TIGR03809 family)
LPDSPALRSFMSQREPARSLDAVAQKWRDLAERRRAHFVELYHSGRWKHYYTEERFLHRMREAIRAADTWAMIAPKPERQAPAEQADPAAKRAPRTAA